VTPAEIIYHRRVQVLDRAGQTSVAEACRTFEISRTTYYRWAGRAQRYGLAAQLPKDRRPPVMATATPPDQVEVVLAEAVARPTLGARQLVCHLADRGVRRSPSGSTRSWVATGSAAAPSGSLPWPSSPDAGGRFGLWSRRAGVRVPSVTRGRRPGTVRRVAVMVVGVPAQ
jgi:transposase-like protein